MGYRFSSIWHEIKQFYDIILKHTFWTVGTNTFINFWNDKWWVCVKSFNKIIVFYKEFDMLYNKICYLDKKI